MLRWHLRALGLQFRLTRTLLRCSGHFTFDVVLCPVLFRGSVGWPMHGSGDQTRQTVLDSHLGKRDVQASSA